MGRTLNLTYNVAPRYTAGSPAAVNEATALRVAQEEREAYEHALTGVYGETDQKRAEMEGLALIAFVMVERPKGWDVEDLITGVRSHWPFEATCPTCQKRKVSCRRGKLEAHLFHKGTGECRAAGTYVGKTLEKLV